MSEVVAQRMADLSSAMLAVMAYQRSDRAGVLTAMQSITKGQSGEALLAVAVLAVDQAARARGESWESVADAILLAAFDPDEQDHIENRLQEDRDE